MQLHAQVYVGNGSSLRNNFNHFHQSKVEEEIGNMTASVQH